MIPKSLAKLINAFDKLPGVSKKQAERLAYFLIVDEKNTAQDFLWSIEDAKSKIRPCQKCGFFAEGDFCEICLDKSRQKILVIVENSLDVIKFEANGHIKPYYHVLGNLVSINKKTETLNNLNIANIKERASESKEIILALSSSLEGIVTANIVKDILSDFKVMQLAQGIPLGAALEYIDDVTLKLALDNRKEIK